MLSFCGIDAAVACVASALLVRRVLGESAGLAGAGATGSAVEGPATVVCAELTTSGATASDVAGVFVFFAAGAGDFVFFVAAMRLLGSVRIEAGS